MRPRGSVETREPGRAQEAQGEARETREPGRARESPGRAREPRESSGSSGRSQGSQEDQWRAQKTWRTPWLSQGLPLDHPQALLGTPSGKAL